MLFFGCGDCQQGWERAKDPSCQVWCPSGRRGEDFPFPPALLVARCCTVGPLLQRVTMFLHTATLLVVTVMQNADLEHP